MATAKYRPENFEKKYQRKNEVNFIDVSFQLFLSQMPTEFLKMSTELESEKQPAPSNV